VTGRGSAEPSHRRDVRRVDDAGPGDRRQ
jgi:hypothetical protein